jgi:hypothetical protein
MTNKNHWHNELLSTRKKIINQKRLSHKFKSDKRREMKEKTNSQL